MATSILSGIYAIRNTISRRIYVGAARDIKSRWRAHRKLLRSGKHHAVRLQRSWTKHGESVFSFDVLEAINCSECSSLEAFKVLLKSREQYWMDISKAASKDQGFNSLRAAFSPLGFKHSEATRAKHREWWTPERIARFKEIRSNWVISPEGRAKISQAKKGLIRTAEHSAKISAAKKGKPLSPEHRAKLALVGMGRKHTDEWRAKMSAAGCARISAMSANDRQKRVAPLNSPESIVKRGKRISASLRARFAKQREQEQARQHLLPLPSPKPLEEPSKSQQSTTV